MPLCDQILPDLDAVFFQTDDFAQKHVLNGKPMLVVDDTDSLIDWTDGQHTDGLYTSDLLLRVRASEYGARPKERSAVRYDEKVYRVVEATEERGVYVLRLRRAEM